MRKFISLAAVALLAGCASAPQKPAASVAASKPVVAASTGGGVVKSAGCGQMGPPGAFMLGPQLKGQALRERIAQAERAPIGSDQNPVRVCQPSGQQAYLRQLRCSDGSAPAFSRIGNFGAGIYGTIIDKYTVTCGKGEPRQSTITMDMYFPDNQTSAPPPGFGVGG
jgi:hypothetical protein